MDPFRSTDKLTKSNDPHSLAAAALRVFAADPDQLALFLSLTGITPQTLREAAKTPGFAAAVLDHVLGDDSLVRAVAAEAGIAPESVAAARAAMDRPSRR